MTHSGQMLKLSEEDARVTPARCSIAFADVLTRLLCKKEEAGAVTSLQLAAI
jgi:hypothetical protein